MSGYSVDPSMVHVDFFKESGKWYTTEAVKWLEWDGDKHPQTVFEESLAKHLKGRLVGMRAVCLEPYHKNEFPLMATVGKE